MTNSIELQGFGQRLIEKDDEWQKVRQKDKKTDINE